MAPSRKRRQVSALKFCRNTSYLPTSSRSRRKKKRKSLDKRREDAVHLSRMIAKKMLRKKWVTKWRLMETRTLKIKS